MKMKLIVWLIIATSLAVARSSEDKQKKNSCGSERTICPGGHYKSRIGISDKGECYRYYPILKNYEDAVRTCKQMNEGTLVMANDNGFVEAVLNNPNYTAVDFGNLTWSRFVKQLRNLCYVYEIMNREGHLEKPCTEKYQFSCKTKAARKVETKYTYREARSYCKENHGQRIYSPSSTKDWNRTRDWLKTNWKTTEHVPFLMGVWQYNNGKWCHQNANGCNVVRDVPFTLDIRPDTKKQFIAIQWTNNKMKTVSVGKDREGHFMCGTLPKEPVMVPQCVQHSDFNSQKSQGNNVLHYAVPVAIVIVIMIAIIIILVTIKMKNRRTKKRLTSSENTSYGSRENNVSLGGVTNDAFRPDNTHRNLTNAHSSPGTNKWGISKDVMRGNVTGANNENYLEDVVLEKDLQPRLKSITYININNISTTLGALAIITENSKRATGPIDRSKVNLTQAPEDNSQYDDTKSSSYGYEVPINHPKHHYLSFSTDESDHTDTESPDIKNRRRVFQGHTPSTTPPREHRQQRNENQKFETATNMRNKFLPLKPAPTYVNAKNVWEEMIGTNNITLPQHKNNRPEGDREQSIVTVTSYGMRRRSVSDPLFHIYESIKSKSGERPCQNQYVGSKEILKDLLSNDKRKRSKTLGNICDDEILKDISTPAIMSTNL